MIISVKPGDNHLIFVRFHRGSAGPIPALLGHEQTGHLLVAYRYCRNDQFDKLDLFGPDYRGVLPLSGRRFNRRDVPTACWIGVMYINFSVLHRTNRYFVFIQLPVRHIPNAWLRIHLSAVFRCNHLHRIHNRHHRLCLYGRLFADNCQPKGSTGYVARVGGRE